MTGSCAKSLQKIIFLRQHFSCHPAKDYELRWFTPRCEVKLCGHATLAAACVVWRVLNPSLDTIRFNARFQGALTVNKGSDGLRMNFPALIPRPLRNLPAILYRAFGQEAEVVEAAEVDETTSRAWAMRAQSGVCIHLVLLGTTAPFCRVVTAPGANAGFVSRYFAPGYAIPEDPV